METVRRPRSIIVRLLGGSQHSIVIFPDELQDFTAVIEVLQRELAPLSVWKECAVEFHRQFQDSSLREILGDIIYALESSDGKFLSSHTNI